MTRISPKLIRQALREQQLLPFLLPECRTLEQARTELRWIQTELKVPAEVHKACVLRARGVPLQYILGSQPFGPLLVQCQPGVLIPRWETEEWAYELGKRFAVAQQEALELIDLCTGTGCVALLLRYMIHGAQATAVDISRTAVALARKNSLSQNVPITVLQQDVLRPITGDLSGRHFDLLTCNPPYVPRSTYVGSCTTSVRRYEPKLALIADKEFYANLVDSWLQRTDSFVYEVGQLEQCEYVLSKVEGHPDISDAWRVGFREDANGKTRVVYGYRRNSKRPLEAIFKGFGRIMH
ncbi:HFL321Cp [Eremothecium sinecaudum]|uniref:peptide chain release factor N(5)-glutamine methyltransferase n=1 Tax=Eremothecium sinecaudum TaxID=45286 RepID=A0A0X8HU54_9SACH|nr:HFL321Cp [Eremothecium sinecaudum]AMD21535.1 HFL321Cp [Eremothecium sinecaudum]